MLQILASAEMVVAYLLLFGLFARLGSAREARVAALAFMCAVPLFLGQESLDFRYWEGEVAVILTLLSLWVIVNIDKGGKAPPSVRDQTLLILLLAATAFVSPPLGVGLALGAVLLGFRRWTWPTRIRTGLLTIAVFGLMLAPWALRNEHMLGKPIPAAEQCRTGADDRAQRSGARACRREWIDRDDGRDSSDAQRPGQGSGQAGRRSGLYG